MKTAFMLACLAAGSILAAEPAAKPGEKLYLAKCASCHGKDGKGSAAMAKMFKLKLEALDLTDAGTLSKKDEELVAITEKGAGKMPAYKGKLKDEELKAVVEFLRSLAVPKAASKK